MNAWMLLLAGTLAGVIIALQSWVLIEIISLKVIVARQQFQINRSVSDAESEKGTRKRNSDDVEARLRKLEQHHA